MMECEAEKIGLKVGTAIFLVVGTQELICKDCELEKCPYHLKDYSKQVYKRALATSTEGEG